MPQLVSSSIPRAASAVRQGTAVPVMYIVLLTAWLFDFLSEGQGEGLNIQAYFVAAYLFALIHLLVSYRDTGQRVHGLGALIGCGALYLGVSVTVGVINEQATYLILRNALTVAIYLSGALVTARVVLNSDPAKVRGILAIFCLLYALWNFVYAYLSIGAIDYTHVRHSIIGVSVISALAYVTLAIIFSLNKAELLAMLVNGAIVLASITRTYLVVLVGQLMIVAGFARRLMSPRAIGFGLSALVGIGATLFLGQLQLERWQDRIFGFGSGHIESQTIETRFSEWSFMATEWTSSIGHFLFGSGLAAKTIYYLPTELGSGTESMIGFGHNQHLSMLFTAGVIGGLPLLILQLRQGWTSWRFARQAIAHPQLRNDVVFLGTWGALTILGSLLANVFDPIFSVRGDALWYGIGTGLLLGAQARFDPANAARTRLPNAPRAPQPSPA